MATVRFCDYTKKRLGSSEETFLIAIEDKEFEVSAEGKDALISHLEADELPAMTVVAAPPVPVPAAPIVAAPPAPLINVETAGDAFAPGPGSAPQPEQSVVGEPGIVEQTTDDRPPIQLEIPENPKKRLGLPSKATYERVIEDATRFEEGTLSALTPGKARKKAGQRLRDVESDQENALKRQGGSQVNVNNNYKDAPGFNRGE